MLETFPITIEVDARAARVYNMASTEQRRKLAALLSLKLTEAIRAERTLETVMQEISQNAQERGLTEAMLEQMLQDE